MNVKSLINLLTVSKKDALVVVEVPTADGGIRYAQTVARLDRVVWNDEDDERVAVVIILEEEPCKPNES
jgi:hypothetical protein